MRSRSVHGIRGLLLAAAALAVSATAASGQDPSAEQAAPPTAPAPKKAPASAPEPKSLDELLDMVRSGYRQERELNQQRIERFKQAKEQQEEQLRMALQTVAAEEARSERLETTFSTNEVELAQLEDNLTQRLGTMGELFGVVRQVAGDMQANVWESITSSQIPDREKLLEKLGRGSELPSTDDLEKLWFELQREMTQQGKVVRYPAAVLTVGGSEEQRDVIRAGVVAGVANGRYLVWDPEIQRIRELNRQPPARYLETVSRYESNTGSGFSALAVDPSRGSLLTALIDTPMEPITPITACMPKG